MGVGDLNVVDEILIVMMIEKVKVDKDDRPEEEVRMLNVEIES